MAMIEKVYLLQMPNGAFVRALDEIGEPVLCCLSREDAEDCCECQRDVYALDCNVIEVELKAPILGK